jgi:hypothetical protein
MSPDLGLVDAARRGDGVGDADRHRERLGGVPAAGVHLRTHGSTFNVAAAYLDDNVVFFTYILHIYLHIFLPEFIACVVISVA